MNFSQWSTELSKQQERMKETALTDVEESLGINDKQVSVILGRGRDPVYGIVSVDGLDTHTRRLRPLYTHHKDEFDAMLDSLTTSVDTVMEATNLLMESLTENAIPDAMIERMKGDQTSGDPKELVASSVKQKLETLQETLLKRLYPKTPTDEVVLKSFELEFPAVAGRKLEVDFAWGKISLRWGKVEFDASGRTRVPDTEEGMYFLANHDFIEAKLLKACGGMIDNLTN